MIRHWIRELKWWKKYWNKERKMDDEKVSHEPVEHIANAAKAAHQHQASTVERKPQVAREIDQLAQGITVLENLVESLHTRLSAVSSPAIRGDQPQRPTEPMVPVAAGIHTQTDRVLDVSARLEEILQSLEV